MLLRRCLVAVAVCAAITLPAPAADKPALADGNYVLTYSFGAGAETQVAIIKVAGTDGKYTAEVVATPPGQQGRPAPKVTVGEPKVANGLVTFPVDVGPNKFAFEGKLDAQTPKHVAGSMEVRTTVLRANLAGTDKDEFEKPAPVKVPDELQQVNKLRSEPFLLQSKARQEKDADKKQELLNRVKAAKKEAEEKVPGLLVKVVDANPDTAAGYYATLDLLGEVGKTKATAADVKKWADAAVAFAAKHGPRFEKYAVARLAEGLATQAQFGAVAVPFAEKYVAGAAKATAADRLKAYTALAAALEGAGKTAEAKAARGTVAALDAELDAEYRKTVPPFAPEKYAGRKDAGANRVAVVELFTGAQCPPCVAADVGFDGLEKAYSPKEVALLQYHMHIPGPDALTNPDTTARWDYYREKLPKYVIGTPSTLLNGKEIPRGSGGMANAAASFQGYRKEIDPVLEQKTDLTIGGTATLADGAVTVNATVGGMDKPADGHKVRAFLVEEEVKYPGGNGLRFHHMVVRSAFGHVGGWAAKDLKGGKVSATVKLDDLKKGLTHYLDEYAKNERPFVTPTDRPMEMKHLKVIVLVQDDETGEILQAAQMDVAGGKS